MTYQNLQEALKYFIDRENYGSIEGILLKDYNDDNNFLVVLSGDRYYSIGKKHIKEPYSVGEFQKLWIEHGSNLWNCVNSSFDWKDIKTLTITELHSLINEKITIHPMVARIARETALAVALTPYKHLREVILSPSKGGLLPPGSPIGDPGSDIGNTTDNLYIGGAGRDSDGAFHDGLYYDQSQILETCDHIATAIHNEPNAGWRLLEKLEYAPKAAKLISGNKQVKDAIKIFADALKIQIPNK